MTETKIESQSPEGRRLVLLGVGNVALAVSAAATSYLKKIGTTRNAERLVAIESHGIQPFLLTSQPEGSMNKLFADADVLVSFPPHEQSDETLAQFAQTARRIVYISSTGVYGRTTGRIDENSEVDREQPQAAARLHAETIWRQRGATVLRAPGIYGPATGLHLRLRDRTYRLPGDGKNHISRIHLDDLAQIVLAALARGPAGALYVVGDQEPVPQIEVVTWLCKKMALPLPPSVSIDEVSLTQRGDRQVVADKVLNELNLRLLFPSYREGYSQCLTVAGYQS